MSKTFQSIKLTDDYYDYEKNDREISVVGRLKRHLPYWRSINCSAYILDVLTKGYVIPVLGEVESAILRNNKSSRDHPEFVRHEIDELLQKKAIVECVSPPKVVNPLTVAEKNGKLRLVIHLRHINKRLVKTKCKFDGHDTALQFLTLDSFMTVFDLKSGYHHIEVVQSQHDLLGFSYTDFTGRIRYFKYVVLPFGLATAGLIFTKVLREMIKHWRSQEIQAVAFLDDGLQTNLTYQKSLQHALLIKGSLLEAGWIPHKTKSCWIPMKVLTWLGFVINLLEGKIFCTEARVQKALILIRKAVKRDTLHVKTLSKISGCITSMERSHGDIVFLFTKFMNLTIAEADSWGCFVNVSEQVKTELKFWLNNLEKENGMHIFTETALGHMSFSDASDTGCASVLMPCPQHEKLVVTKQFNEQEAATSSTERELLGVLHGLIALKDKLQGKAITWFTDCKNVARIVKRGSMKAYLLNLALAIFHVAKQNKISLQVIWIPRYQNEEADFWSRVRDFDDWGVSEEWFHKICKYFGLTATVDRFADHRNRKTARFNSRFYHSEAEATDCFTQNWADEVNWVVPPIFMVIRAIRYCELCQATMILVVPKWQSAVFWPKLSQLLRRPDGVVKNKAIMENIFTRGTTNTSIFGSKDWRGQSMALHISFKK